MEWIEAHPLPRDIGTAPGDDEANDGVDDAGDSANFPGEISGDQHGPPEIED
jgi:hypothetical protein